MIKFSCHCNHILEVPEDMAGKSMQCPNCQRLVDVPTMNEQQELLEDGTFRLDEPEPRDPGQFERMRYVYAKDKVDENGNEIDKRQTLEELAAAGTDPDIYEFEHRPTAPKYDPETGELIRPLDLAPNPSATPHPSQVPMATNALNYASPAHQVALEYSPLARMFTPINLAAMFFVLFFQLFFYLAAFSLFLTVAAVFFIGPALIAHYGNVIEEIGIEERDELPRFLRHFNFIDDIWHPFAHVFLAWMVCFGPGFVLWCYWVAHGWPLKPAVMVVSALDVAGLIFFPAVMLTTTTSGSLLNLRPYRVMAVIAQIGPRYAWLVILYFVAITIYLLGMLTVPIQAMLFAAMQRHSTNIFSGPFPIALLMTGIFLMHYFAWLLGLYYRKLHQKFPWVYHQWERTIPGVNAPRYSKPVKRKSVLATDGEIKGD
jgi:hypothetical protein